MSDELSRLREAYLDAKYGNEPPSAVEDFTKGWEYAFAHMNQPQTAETCPDGHPMWALIVVETTAKEFIDNRVMAKQICSICETVRQAVAKVEVERDECRTLYESSQEALRETMTEHTASEAEHERVAVQNLTDLQVLIAERDALLARLKCYEPQESTEVGSTQIWL